MHDPSWIAFLIFAADLMIRVGFSIRVIMRRRPVGVSLAWLTIILIFPFFGALVYVSFGELLLGQRRAAWAGKIHKPYQRWLDELKERYRVDLATISPDAQSLIQLTEAAVGIPAFPDNQLELLGDWRTSLQSLIRDIEAAKRTCHLEFYIWNPGGMADEVTEALLRAVTRGVICRVLVDDVGSRPFLRSELAARLRDGGVALKAALPAGLIRNLFVRFDLRLHRKIVVIDGEIAYTGSLNLVDPRYFKQTSGVGEWVDAMVRVRGPAVEGLGITFLEDWELERSEGVETLRQTGDIHPPRRDGTSILQVAPSGPARHSEAIQEILLMAIYLARRELILTTPYFVPDEPLLTALVSAARRGVDVILILPAHVDSKLVRIASQAFKGDLLAAGVNVLLFEGGLLHTKSITVDGEFSLFGSLNLDPRSLHLNFEITLCIYDAEFTRQLRQLQHSYIAQSTPMDLDAWQSRSSLVKLAENTARLLGPLL